MVGTAGTSLKDTAVEPCSTRTGSGGAGLIADGMMLIFVAGTVPAAMLITGKALVHAEHARAALLVELVVSGVWSHHLLSDGPAGDPQDPRREKR